MSRAYLPEMIQESTSGVHQTPGIEIGGGGEWILMCWKATSGCLANAKIVILFLSCFLPLILFGKNNQYPDIPAKMWEQVAPYLMSDSHPLKQTLDSLFSKTRIIQDRDSLVKAGFEGVNSRDISKVIVTRHPQMPGYVFKIFTDDRLSYSYGRPEYVLWARRARGAELVRQEIARQGWQAYFKAPVKWIYALPATPKAKSVHLQKNFILVEEDMDLLPKLESKKRWQDGTITPQQLGMLFHLLTAVGLYDSCSTCNIPICKDGRIAFIDTQTNSRWPIPYSRLFRSLNSELSDVWKQLIGEHIKRGGRVKKH